MRSAQLTLVGKSSTMAEIMRVHIEHNLRFVVLSIQDFLSLGQGLDWGTN